MLNLPKPPDNEKILEYKTFWNDGDFSYHYYPPTEERLLANDKILFLCFHGEKDGWIGANHGEDEFHVCDGNDRGEYVASFKDFDEAMIYYLMT